MAMSMHHNNKKRIICFCGLLPFVLVIVALFGCNETEKRIHPETYSFSAHGACFSVGDDTDEVIASLGEPNSHSSAPSCAGMGNDELFVYNGFRIMAHRLGSESSIVKIELTNDTAATFEGVSVGDSSDRVRAVYGEGEEFSGGVEYRAERCNLRFYIKDGKIVRIVFLQ